MSYISHPVPSHSPAHRQNVSRTFGALTISTSVTGSATMALTFGVSSSGTATGGGQAVVVTPVSQPTVELFPASKIVKVPPSLFGSSTAGFVFGVSSSGIPTAFGTSTVGITFGVSSAGTATGAVQAVVVTSVSQPVVELFPASKIVKVSPSLFGSSTAGFVFGVSSAGTPTAFGAATAAYVFGVASSGSTAGPSDVPVVYRAQQPQGYPQQQQVSVALQALLATDHGSATAALTFGVSSAGTASGGTAPALGVALAGGTNQGRTHRQPLPPSSIQIDLESRAFSVLRSTPPIYRVIVPGGTNQGFQFEAVTQEKAIRLSQRIYTGHAPGQVSGAASMALTFGASTLGQATASGAVSLSMTFGIGTTGIRGTSIVLVPTNDSTITLVPLDPVVMP